MFDLGIQELIVIFIVALMVFGPKRLPELARTLGKTMGQLKRAMHDIKTEVNREMEEANPIPRLDEFTAFNTLPDDMKDKVLNPDSMKVEEKLKTPEPPVEGESTDTGKDGEPVMYADEEDVREKGD